MQSNTNVKSHGEMVYVRPGLYVYKNTGMFLHAETVRSVLQQVDERKKWKTKRYKKGTFHVNNLPVNYSTYIAYNHQTKSYDVFAIYRPPGLDKNKEVGNGNFGKIKWAQNLRTGEIVAVKTIKQTEIITKNRVNNEQKILIATGQSKCPWVFRRKSKKHKFIKADILVRWEQGISLSSLLASGIKLPNEIRDEIANKILLAVQKLHQQGIIHCDLKPGHFIINFIPKDSGEFEVKVNILDYGLGMITQNKSGTDVRKGTPGYMAPEINDASGKKTYNEKTDMYALGVIFSKLYHLYEKSKAKNEPIDAEQQSEKSETSKSVSSMLERTSQEIEVQEEKQAAYQEESREEQETFIQTFIKKMQSNLPDKRPTIADALKQLENLQKDHKPVDEAVLKKTLKEINDLIDIPPTSPGKPLPQKKKESSPSIFKSFIYAIISYILKGAALIANSSSGSIFTLGLLTNTHLSNASNNDTLPPASCPVKHSKILSKLVKKPEQEQQKKIGFCRSSSAYWNRFCFTRIAS